MTGYALHRLVIDDTPPSMNRVGGRSAWRKWANAKKEWQNALIFALDTIDFPRDLSAVTASAQLRFPTNRRRDSDNYSALLAKALGDALQEGWLPDDTPEYFQFEPVCFDPVKGPERTTVLLVEGVQPSMFLGAWEAA